MSEQKRKSWILNEYFEVDFCWTFWLSWILPTDAMYAYYASTKLSYLNTFSFIRRPFSRYLIFYWFQMNEILKYLFATHAFIVALSSHFKLGFTKMFWKGNVWQNISLFSKCFADNDFKINSWNYHNMDSKNIRSNEQCSFNILKWWPLLLKIQFPTK